jgi:hypothetical protein
MTKLILRINLNPTTKPGIRALLMSALVHLPLFGIFLFRTSPQVRNLAVTCLSQQ